MSRASKYILFIIFLSGLICFSHLALAQEKTENGVVDRPVVEYKSGRLRDPFQTYIANKKKEKEEVAVPANDRPAAPRFNFNKLKVQGIIWGGRIPQAIINNKVFTVGDSIEGAEIVNIGKKEVILNFAGEMINLAASGQKAVAQERKQEVK